MRSASRTFSLSSVAGVSLAALLASSAQAALTISTDATSNVTCTAGVCTATAADAVLNVTDVTTMLAAGSLTVQSGSQAQDITVGAPFSWTSSTMLTLDAYRSIIVNKTVSDAGPAALMLTSNDGGEKGELRFGPKGNITFLSKANSLTINAQSYMLENSISALADAIAAKPGKNYALANSYDASADGVYFKAPIQTPVAGTVEGLGNTISNLSIVHPKNSKDDFGLFSAVASVGTIASFRLKKVFINVGRGRKVAGALVARNQGLLIDDYADGMVKTQTIGAGGLVGANSGTIIASSANVRVTSQTRAGGLVSGTSGGTISLSSASGAVQGAETAGGLVGNNDGVISASFATGTVTGGTSAYVGGLAGDNDETRVIRDSYATGAVTGGDNAEVGGFIGDNYETVSTSYSTGIPTGGSGSFVGGFAGSGTNPVFDDCYWDTTTSDTDEGIGGMEIAGITGLTDDQMKSGLPKGFDKKIWAQDRKINNGYPYLIANPPPK